MTEAAEPEKKTGRRKLLALMILGVTGAGLGAGAALPIVFAGPGEAAALASTTETALAPRTANLSIGRIAVNLRGAEASLGRPRNLIIDTIVEYDPALETGHVAASGEAGDHGGDAAPADPMQARQPRMRDAFIEYLSQLSEQDVTGSSGLASTRAELLRRARAVAGNDAPRALLIQDFIIQ